jgi:AraC-like DNA-binding protein
MRLSYGNVSIRELVDETGWSHRYFIERFRQQLGVTPKTASIQQPPGTVMCTDLPR